MLQTTTPVTAPTSNHGHLAETHVVENQPPPLRDYNVYAQDAALVEAVAREGAAWAAPQLQAFGALTGSQIGRAHV